MSLLRCPECDRENVSSTAEACPSCGFNIRGHFEQINAEKKREEARQKSAQFQAEIEQARLEAVTTPDKPKFPVGIGVIGAVFVALAIPDLDATQRDIEYSIAHGNGDPHLKSVIMLIFGIAVLLFCLYLYVKRREKYKLSQDDFEAYRKEVISEEDERIKASIEQAKMNSANSYKCPNCGKSAGEKISTTGKIVSVGALGLASNKIGKSYKCKSCGYLW